MSYNNIPAYPVYVDAGKSIGPLETWRLCIGIGGINAIPAEDAVGDAGFKAVQALRLPLVRIFMQQYLDPLKISSGSDVGSSSGGDDFNGCGDGGGGSGDGSVSSSSYDWSKMDAYVHSAAKLGNVMAAFCLKPAALFGEKDQTVIYPPDKDAFAEYITAIAARYDGVITHWEVGNETDIGENGGCPLLIKDDDEYNEYYRFVASALHRGSSKAKVGGSAIANAAAGSQLASLIAYCRAGNAPLDIVSWHIYNSDPEEHAALVRKYAALLHDWPGGERPIMAVTEWACDFPSETGAVVETADESWRSAAFFAAACRYLDEGLDYSFFYHLYDCTLYHDDFEPFFEDPQIMDKHWNQVPHRFGMFAHDGSARPHYQLWRMLRTIGGDNACRGYARGDNAYRGSARRGNAYRGSARRGNTDKDGACINDIDKNGADSTTSDACDAAARLAVQCEYPGFITLAGCSSIPDSNCNADSNTAATCGSNAAATCDSNAAATCTSDTAPARASFSLIIANFNTRETRPAIADVWFKNLEPGVYDTVTELLNGRENLSRDGLSLEPIDRRDISTIGEWRCPTYLPPGAVAKITIIKRL